jgi:hypothetical protein
MMDVDPTSTTTTPLPGTPGDSIRLTRDCKTPRTVVVTDLCPAGMERGLW